MQVAFAKAHGMDPTNVGGDIDFWFESNLFNLLVSEFNRTVILWEDVYPMVNGSWVNASTHLITEQWDGAAGV